MRQLRTVLGALLFVAVALVITPGVAEATPQNCSPGCGGQMPQDPAPTPAPQPQPPAQPQQQQPPVPAPQPQPAPQPEPAPQPTPTTTPTTTPTPTPDKEPATGGTTVPPLPGRSNGPANGPTVPQGDPKPAVDGTPTASASPSRDAQAPTTQSSAVSNGARSTAGLGESSSQARTQAIPVTADQPVLQTVEAPAPAVVYGPPAPDAATIKVKAATQAKAINANTTSSHRIPGRNGFENLLTLVVVSLFVARVKAREALVQDVLEESTNEELDVFDVTTINGKTDEVCGADEMSCSLPVVAELGYETVTPVTISPRHDLTLADLFPATVKDSTFEKLTLSYADDTARVSELSEERSLVALFN